MCSSDLHLDLPAGATAAWAPGETRTVDLVAYGGASGVGRTAAVPERGDGSPGAAEHAPLPRRRIPAEEALARFGPTAGDRVRLGDTDLWVRVAEDRTAAGDEPVWGYGKTVRVGMAQVGHPSLSELDVLIAGVLVLDPLLGAVKADIGIKDGRIAGVGRVGNPGISDGIEIGRAHV